MASNTLSHSFFLIKISSLHWNALRIIVGRNYGGKSPVSIKCYNLHCFKEVVILLCKIILETRRRSQCRGSALFTIPLRVCKFFNKYVHCAKIHRLFYISNDLVITFKISERVMFVLLVNFYLVSCRPELCRRKIFRN